jgi:hypothetical protein
MIQQSESACSPARVARASRVMPVSALVNVLGDAQFRSLAGQSNCIIGAASMARKSRREARYSVDMSVKAWDLAKAGSALEIAIRDRDDLLGTIRIGQGGFHWHPAHGKKGFKRIRWRNLAKDLNQHY